MKVLQGATRCTNLPNTQLANLFGEEFLKLAGIIGGLYQQNDISGLREAEHVLETILGRTRVFREDLTRCQRLQEDGDKTQFN